MSSVAEDPSPSGFWDSRTGWRSLTRKVLLEPIPGGSRWAAAFGSLLLFTFALQVATGILLMMNYAPSVSTAWASVKFIQEDVTLGWLIRGLHHWGSSAMVILLLFHLVQVFIWGAYKRPREFTWMVGVVLLGLTLVLAFTGYLLPWDQKAYWASKVGLGMVSTTPLIGDSLRTFLQGGASLATEVMFLPVGVVRYRLLFADPQPHQGTATCRANERLHVLSPFSCEGNSTLSWLLRCLGWPDGTGRIKHCVGRHHHSRFIEWSAE